MITIDKALELLHRQLATPLQGETPDMQQAIKLGIEALKSVRTGRKVGLHFEAKLLEGETE